MTKDQLVDNLAYNSLKVCTFFVFTIRVIAEMNEKFEVANAKHEISEIERLMVQKNVEELRDSKERCYEISLECAKTLKSSFTKVGAYSSEQK